MCSVYRNTMYYVLYTYILCTMYYIPIYYGHYVLYTIHYYILIYYVLFTRYYVLCTMYMYVLLHIANMHSRALLHLWVPTPAQGALECTSAKSPLSIVYKPCLSFECYSVHMRPPTFTTTAATTMATAVATAHNYCHDYDQTTSANTTTTNTYN